MKTLFSLVVALVTAILALALPIPWQPIDIFLVVILGIAHVRGERAALPVAILLGAVADIFSSAPFGILLALYPLMLGALYLLGQYVITNRSTGSLVAHALLGTAMLHGGVYIGSALSAFLSRQNPAVGVANHTILALVINTAALLAWILVRNYLVRRYESRFLRRGGTLTLQV